MTNLPDWRSWWRSSQLADRSGTPSSLVLLARHSAASLTYLDFAADAHYRAGGGCRARIFRPSTAGSAPVQTPAGVGRPSLAVPL